MQTEVGKWGNSLAIRLPAALMREWGCGVGSKLELSVKDGALVIASADRVRQVQNTEQRLEAFRAQFGGLHYTVDEFLTDRKQEWGE